MNKMIFETNKHTLTVEQSKDFDKSYKCEVTDKDNNKIVEWTHSKEHFNYEIVGGLEELINKHVEDNNKWNAWREAINEQDWKENTFCIEDMIIGKGIHKPLETWNGWEVPYFTKEEWANIESQCDFPLFIRFENDKMYARDTNCCDCAIEGGICEYCEEYEVTPIEHNGQLYYDLSGWIWTIQED